MVNISPKEILEKFDSDTERINHDNLVRGLIPWCNFVTKQFLSIHYYNTELEFNDYKNSAILGLYSAIRNYNPEKGSFKSYSFKYMYYEMRKILVKSNEYQFRVSSDHILYPNAEEYDDFYHIFSNNSVLLDGESLVGECDSMESRIVERLRIAGLVKNLCNEKQQVIIGHYFLSLPMKEIAILMKVSSSRISQIHTTALHDLKIKLT